MKQCPKGGVSRGFPSSATPQRNDMSRGSTKLVTEPKKPQDRVASGHCISGVVLEPQDISANGRAPISRNRQIKPNRHRICPAGLAPSEPYRPLNSARQMASERVTQNPQPRRYDANGDLTDAFVAWAVSRWHTETDNRTENNMSGNGKPIDTAAMYAAQQSAEGIDSDNYINAEYLIGKDSVREVSNDTRAIVHAILAVADAMYAVASELLATRESV